MEKLFHEISTITSVHGLFLLSESGEVLFESDQRWLDTGDGFSRIKKTIGVMCGPVYAIFSFENGYLYFYRTKIGYLLVSTEPSVSDTRVVDGCAAVVRKLTDPNNRKEILLQALAESRQALKPQIVKSLAPYSDTEVAQELIRLLAEERNFNTEIRDSLLLSLCETLGNCPSEQVFRSLQEFLKNTPHLGTDILQAAETAIRQIKISLPTEKKNPVQAKTLRPVSTAQENLSASERGNTLSITNLSEEQQIREFLAKNEKEKGTRLLKETIAEMARKRRFEDAENLRDWLMEIDPMALSDIINAAEIIENEKNTAINKDYFAIWSDLREVLDPNEFSTLYHSLDHKQFSKGEIIITQGSPQSALYFVNSGRVELFFQENGKDVQIKTIGQGEILGAGTFFETSVWTMSARSLGAEMSCLKIDKLQQWQKNLPALESKLNDFCIRFKIPHESFRRMGRDRRVFERVRIAGRVAMSLLDKNGKETGIGATGELFDLSAGGVAFFLRISQKKNARLLFGKKVHLTMASTVIPNFIMTGNILAVRSQPVVGNEYSVHVRFNRVLDQNELKNLLDAGKEKL